MTTRRRFLKLGGAALAAVAVPVAVDLERRASTVQEVMGTRGRAVALHPEASVAEGAVEAAMAELERLEELLNPFDPGSEVGRLNRKEGLSDPAPEMVELLEAGSRFSEVTDGAFDVTVASGDGDYRDVVVEGGEVRLEKEVEVDPGGVGVGYAVDSAVREMKRTGVEHGLINVGGDVAVTGGRGRFGSWRIGVKDPRGGHLAEVELRDGALATSGNYERGHILDPRTGGEPEGCLSSTVVADGCLSADVLSTATYVQGPLSGGETAAEEGRGGILLSKEGELIRSGEL